jgi:putative ATPase
VKEVREALDSARRALLRDEQETILFIDEVHRFSKSQQDALLPGVENGDVLLVAATTENPYFSIISPLLSRSLLLRLEALEDSDIELLIDRAIASPKGLNGAVTIAENAKKQLAQLSAGDVRRALNTLEAAAGAALETRKKKKPEISLKILEGALDLATIRYDRQADEHYDTISAFIKSMRGSDVDAALHYLAKMIVAGEDPKFIARRIMIAAAEEVGLADQQALQTAVAAAQATERIGFPEAQLILAEATAAVALAPKSNAITVAIGEAIQDVKSGLGQKTPAHLRDAHYSGAKKLGHGQAYKYAHDSDFAVAKQQYLPDDLHKLGRTYYTPNPRGHELQIQETLPKLRSLLGR